MDKLWITFNMNEKYKIYIEKFISIFVTALLSALIATLQSMLNDHEAIKVAEADPGTAGAIGAILRGAFESIKRTA